MHYDPEACLQISEGDTVKNIVRFCLTSTLLVLAAPSNAEDALSVQRSCSINGWTNNDFGADIQVRSAPVMDAAIIGQLPFTTNNSVDGNRIYSVRFDITGSVNGWLQIDNISDDYNARTTDRLAHTEVKSGWVPADSVRFRIQSARGFESPQQTVAKLIDLKDDRASDMGDIEKVIACEGQWVLIDFRIKYRREDDGRLVALSPDARTKHRAWFRGICGNEETACDIPSETKD